LHFPFQRLEGLIDIVIANENLHVKLLSDQAVDRSDSQAISAMAYVDGTHGTNHGRQEKSRSISTSAAWMKLRAVGGALRARRC
jgi:hypothetical protein